MLAVPARRRIALVAAAMVAAGMALVVVSFIPEAVYWHHQRDIRLYSAAKEASARLELYREENGRYPSTVDGSSMLGQAVTRMAHECERLGYPVAAVEVLSSDGEESGRGDARILVLWDADDHPLVVLFRDSTIGVSPKLVTRERARIPDWVRVLD